MTDVKVLTLNIWNRLGPWEPRLVAIQKTLRREAPDVVGLQEVITTDLGDGFDQGRLLAGELGYHLAFGRSHGEGYSFGNAILSRWPIVRTEVALLPGADVTEPRSLLYAELDTPSGPLPFFVTHLSFRYHEGAIRQAQAVAVADFVAAKASLGALPAVLVGDFNAEPDADEIRYLRGLTTLGRSSSVYFADAFGCVGDPARGATFAKANPFAAPLREPDRRIDYIFVRRTNDDPRGEPIEARVCFDQPVEGVFPSDHFGVIATLRF